MEILAELILNAEKITLQIVSVQMMKSVLRKIIKKQIRCFCYWYQQKEGK